MTTLRRQSGPSSAWSDQIDSRSDARRPSESAIAGDEDGLEGFGQRYLDGVVGAQGVTQLPQAAEQWFVMTSSRWISVERRSCA
jgi:hypothetical protein